MIDLQTEFEAYKAEHGKFGMIRIEDAPSNRADLCAFLLLDALLPYRDMIMLPGSKIIASAHHDLIYLGVDCDKLAEVATKRDILTLVRCGVIYDDDTNSLMMSV